MSFNSTTFRLFKNKPSFVGGVASLLDLSSPTTKFTMSNTEVEADCQSIQADWLAIGGDMRVAIHEYDNRTKS